MATVRLTRTQLDTVVVCPCGRADPAGAADEQGSRDYTCGGCGTVYIISYEVRVERAPDEQQTGEPDLLGYLAQLRLRSAGHDDENEHEP